MAAPRQYELRFYLPEEFVDNKQYISKMDYTLKEIDEYTTNFMCHEELAIDYLKETIGEERTKRIEKYYIDNQKNIGDDIKLYKKNKKYNFEYESEIMFLEDTAILYKEDFKTDLMNFIGLSVAYDNFIERMKLEIRSGFISEIVKPLLMKENLSEEQVSEITNEIVKGAYDGNLTEEKVKYILASKTQMENIDYATDIIMDRYNGSETFRKRAKSKDTMYSAGKFGSYNNNRDFFYDMCELNKEVPNYSLIRRLHEYMRYYDNLVQKTNTEELIESETRVLRKCGMREEEIRQRINEKLHTETEKRRNMFLEKYKAKDEKPYDISENQIVFDEVEEYIYRINDSDDVKKK